MPKKNETELIKDSKNRILTAKGYSFLNKCIEIAAKQRGLTIYHSEFKETKKQLSELLKHLIFDKNYNVEQIKQVIKNRIKYESKQVK